MSEQLRHTQHSGKPKVGYTSREDALAHRQALLDADMDAGHLLSAPQIYVCATCGLWHVGNGSKKPVGATRRTANPKGEQ